MLRLSIIIPLERNSRLLEECLVSVLENRPAHCEVLVVLDQHYDDPYDLQDEVRFIPARGANLAAAFNAGLQASQGEFVHLLRCGVEATAGWADAALAPFDDPRVAAVAPSLHHRQDPEITLTKGVTSRYGVRKLVASVPSGVPLGPTIGGGFYRAQALRQAGGMSEKLGIYADADLLMQLLGLGWTTHAASNSILLARPEKRPRGFKHGLHAQRLFYKHAAAAGRWAKWRHPFQVAADFCGHWPHMFSAMNSLAGRAWACLEHLRSGKTPEAPARATGEAETARVAETSRFSAVSPLERPRIDPPHHDLRREREHHATIRNMEQVRESL